MRSELLDQSKRECQGEVEVGKGAEREKKLGFRHNICDILSTQS